MALKFVNGLAAAPPSIIAARPCDDTGPGFNASTGNGWFVTLSACFLNPSMILPFCWVVDFTFNAVFSFVDSDREATVLVLAVLERDAALILAILNGFGL
jgi:hypothetical protein